LSSGTRTIISYPELVPAHCIANRKNDLYKQE
jgi:hypothetical protein